MKHIAWGSLFIAFGLVFHACGGAQPAPEPEPEEEPETQPAADNMRAHFADVASARDAVIQGDVEGVREPLSRIAAAEYGADMPWDWREWVHEMQESASGYSEVADLTAAANAVASLTESCADCHRTTLGGPAAAPENVPDEMPDLAGRMDAHAWGTEQLWLGLTAPSHEAWARGTEAIMGDPLVREEQETNEALAPHLDTIRALGIRAQDARQPAEKAAVYAEIISTCAVCHSGLDGQR